MSHLGDNLRRLTGLYRTMARIRAFEETAVAAHKAGEIPGPLHVSIGQEAVATGICVNLRADDRITSNHRGHGHAIAKGADPTIADRAGFGNATALRHHFRLWRGTTPNAYRRLFRGDPA